MTDILDDVGNVAKPNANPVLCAVPIEELIYALLEIEMRSDAELTDFDNLDSCKINLKQIYEIAQELRGRI